MSEWEQVRIRDLARDGRSSFTDGDWIEAPHIKTVGIRLIQTGNISVGRFSNRTHKYISQESFDLLRCTEVVPGDILICRLADPIGRACIVPSLGQRFITSVDVCILRVDEERFDKQLVLQMLNTDEFLDRCNEVSGGTTRQRISRGNLGELTLDVPPLPEQRKIARILTTVDNLIEQTEALIEKYKSIKQGMMHDLFTRGVDSSGRLRPSYEDAPELYKESPLGWIPKEWEAAVLGEEIGAITSGWSPICDAEIAAEGEWAILKTTAVVWDGYDDGENKRLPYHLQPLPKIEVVKDDILITRKGPVERVGVVVHVPETRSHMMIPDTVFRVRIENSSELSPAFVPLALGCEQVQTDWFGRKIGLADAQVNVNHGILRSTILPKPNQDEQTAICTRMRAIQDTIDAEQAHVDDLASLKTGLMQDLLTGKVRVNVDETEEVTQPCPSAAEGVGV
jgi:type I restriction enzyme, S subunit